MRNAPDGYWLNVRGAAARAGVSTDTIYKECKGVNDDGTPRLRHARIGGNRVLRFLPDWVDDWVMSQEEGGRRSDLGKPHAKRKGDAENGPLQTV